MVAARPSSHIQCFATFFSGSFTKSKPSSHNTGDMEKLAAPKNPDKIRVLCTKCRVTFRERIRNVREGYQVQCPNCSRLITFSTDSGDAGVMRAITEARRIKNGLLLSINRAGSNYSS